MENQPIKIEFNASKICLCITHISETIRIVTALYHSNKNRQPNEVLLPLETDGLPILIPNDQGKFEVSEDEILMWLYKKAFEEFIVGISQSLVEAYRFLKQYTTAKNSETTPIPGGEEGIRTIFEEIDKDALKLHFPQLISEIEKEIGVNLPFKEEVISINQVRNCIVHRNGLVLEKDMNDPTTKSLVLRYCKLRFYIIDTFGQRRELTKEVKSESPYVQRLEVQYQSGNVLRMGINSRITLDGNDINNVTYTCIIFIQSLIEKLPLPPEIKSDLIKPFNVHLEG